jgi:hypothetical protein
LKGVDSALRRLPSEVRNLAGALTRRAETWERMLPQPEEDRLRTFVTVRDLRRWLGDDLITRAVDRSADEPTPSLLKAVLDWSQPFVPVVADGRLEMVVDRAALADQLARMFVADLAGEARRPSY